MSDLEANVPMDQHQQDQKDEWDDDWSDGPKEQPASNAESEPMDASNEDDPNDEWNDYQASFELKPFEVPSEGTNINDLSDECLRTIFEHLTLWELVKVAETCTNLLRVARLTFADRCGQSEVLVKKENSNGFVLSIAKPKGNHIYNYKCWSGLRILRSFGATITKLNVRCDNMSEDQAEKLHDYLNQYCAKTLIELRYDGKSLEQFTKIFEKVERVEFLSSNFSCKWFDIIARFPNLRHLKFSQLNKVECIAAHFPNLDSLEVHMNVYNSRPENFTTTLLMNKQLRDLQVYGFGFGVVFFENVSEYPLLESLSTVGYFHSIGMLYEPNSIQFSALIFLEISSDVIDGLVLSNVSMVCDRLEELTILGSLNQNVIKFINGGWIFMTKLTCYTPETVVDRDVILNLAESAPMLSVFHCSSGQIAIDDAVNFVNICESLQMFTFKLLAAERTNYGPLQVNLSPAWRSSVDDETKCVTLER